MEDSEENKVNEENKDSSDSQDSIDISGNDVESHIQTIFNNIINNNISESPFITTSRSHDTIIRNYLTQELFRNPIMYDSPTMYDSSTMGTFANRANIRPSNLNSVLEESFNEESSFKDVIDDDEFLTLQSVKYKDTNKKNNTCPIICGGFEEDDIVIELPCKHIYTPNAIEKWLKEESSVCPVCRYQFKSKEIKKEVEDSLQEENNMDTDSDPITANNSNYFHNPMQRYLLERIMNPTPNRINMPMNPSPFLFQSTEISEDDSDFQQAIINSMSQLHNSDDNED